MGECNTGSVEVEGSSPSISTKQRLVGNDEFFIIAYFGLLSIYCNCKLSILFNSKRYTMHTKKLNGYLKTVMLKLKK